MTYQEFTTHGWHKGDKIVFKGRQREIFAIDFEAGQILTVTLYLKRRVWVFYGDCEIAPAETEKKNALHS